MQAKWLPITEELYQFQNDGPFCLVSCYGQRVAWNSYSCFPETLILQIFCCVEFNLFFRKTVAICM